MVRLPVMKQCYVCRRSLSFTLFWKNVAKKDGLADECAECGRRKNSNRYYKHRDRYLVEMKIAYQKRKKRVSEENKERRKKDPSFFKNGKLRSEFGISLNQYESISCIQKHKCAICGNKETIVDKRTGKTRALAVDHCHKTKRTRGLLCMACNQGIGNLKESPHIIQSALNYLQKHKEEQCHKT